MYGIILAGGRGERLRPLTDSVPKPMLKVGGKPILEHQILQLKAAGIRDVVIVERCLTESIQRYFGNGERLGMNIRHLLVGPDAGSVDGIKEAMNQIPSEEKDIVLMYGDILSDLKISDLIETHREARPLLTMLAVKPNFLPYGIVTIKVKNGVPIVADIKKEEEVYSVNGAIFVLSREIYPHLPERGDFSKDVLEKSAGKEDFRVYKFDGNWINITSEFDLVRARQEMDEGKFNLEAFRSRGPEGK